MILDGMTRPMPDERRVPIYIHPNVRQRLHSLLMHNEEMRGVGYSAFINRACEVAETAIAEKRRSG